MHACDWSGFDRETVRTLTGLGCRLMHGPDLNVKTSDMDVADDSRGYRQDGDGPTPTARNERNLAGPPSE